ncbi:MAG: DNA primase [Pirellulaceae bacterium]|nr:DNA primase [Pirellulaceae bacterium]
MDSHSDNALPFGFRIVGDCRNDRRLIDWPSAFLAYSECDERAETDRESYLSAFCFGGEFAELLNRTGSTRGYSGVCWSPWLWFDIDRDEIGAATADARRLAAMLVERFSMTGDELPVFYSGSKGFHIGLPTGLWQPAPSNLFHLHCRRFAEQLARVANVAIDSGVYDRVRAFRAPNSRHSKTGRYKRILTLDELLMLKPSRIIELASDPMPFEMPAGFKPNPQAVRDWQQVVDDVERQQVVAVERRQTGVCPSSLNRSTLEFLRDGATTGDRHRRLFSAAANLAEFGCSSELAFVLLSESALDSGLPPSEVRRQIECGLNHRGAQ